MDKDNETPDIRNVQEGGIVPNPNGVSAPRPDLPHDPDRDYRLGKSIFDSYLSAVEFWNPLAHSIIKSHLQNTESLSTRSTAKSMRDASKDYWQANNWGKNKPIPIQKECNNKLFTHNEDGTLNHITSDNIAPLFAKGAENDWPHLILTSNHARAWQNSDLHELMQGICGIARDAWGRTLDICRLAHDTPRADTANKNIVVLACHTERDIFLNGANLIDRRLDLEEDKNESDPANRTLAHMSPAAMRLAKLMMKMMIEPECQSLIDLDRSNFDNNPKLKSVPFIADHMALNAHENSSYIEKHPIILRDDAVRIAKHIKLIGYSKGANTVTDALRFFYQECAHLGAQLQMRDEKGELRAANDNDIKNIISGIALLNIAPGEVPLSKAEKEVLGMKRTTILNDHDLTAGHLVNPNIDDYDDSQDKLIKIIGTKTESGHSVTDALGDDNKSGYIMDLENGRTDIVRTKAAKENAENYQEAQKEIRHFFSSNHCNKIHPTNSVVGEKNITGLEIGSRNRA